MLKSIFLFVIFISTKKLQASFNSPNTISNFIGEPGEFMLPQITQKSKCVVHLKNFASSQPSKAVFGRIVQDNLQTVLWTLWNSTSDSTQINPVLGYHERCSLNIFITSDNKRKTVREVKAVDHYWFKSNKYPRLTNLKNRITIHVVCGCNVDYYTAFYRQSHQVKFLHLLRCPKRPFPNYYVHSTEHEEHLFHRLPQDNTFPAFSFDYDNYYKKSVPSSEYGYFSDGATGPLPSGYCHKTFWLSQEVLDKNMYRCRLPDFVVTALQVKMNFSITYFDYNSKGIDGDFTKAGYILNYVMTPDEAIIFVDFELEINFGRFLFCDKRETRTRLTGNFLRSFQIEVWFYCIPCVVLSLLVLTYYGYSLKVFKFFNLSTSLFHSINSIICLVCDQSLKSIKSRWMYCSLLWAIWILSTFFKNEITSCLIIPVREIGVTHIGELLPKHFSIYFITTIKKKPSLVVEHYHVNKILQAIPIDQRYKYGKMLKGRIKFRKDLSTATILELINNNSGKAAIPIHARDAYQTGILELVQNENVDKVCNYVKRPLSVYLDMLSFRTPVAHEMRIIGRRFWDAGLVRFWANLDKFHTRYTLQEHRIKSLQDMKNNENIINFGNLALVFVLLGASNVLVFIVFILEGRKNLYRTIVRKIKTYISLITSAVKGWFVQSQYLIERILKQQQKTIILYFTRKLRVINNMKTDSRK